MSGYHDGPVIRSFDVFVSPNKLINNSRDTTGLRRHKTHETSMRFVQNHKNDIVEIFEWIMTSSNGNMFRVTGHLCGEFTGLR